MDLLNSAYDTVSTSIWTPWIKTTLLPSMQNILSGAALGVLNVVVVLKNLVIGIIVAVYMLASRKRFVQQGKMVLYSVVKPRWASLITEEVKYADRMFGGFINGKILDSAIIGLLCYIGCLIFKFPSALLVSVIIGVTNVIPFFGPFIGAIPATLLILIQNPIKALWFVLFVLVLQQLDGNIIGPKILGNTTGLSSFWVLFAILLFGGLWGFAGMIVGVPLFAVIYDVIKKLVILRSGAATKSWICSTPITTTSATRRMILPHRKPRRRRPSVDKIVSIFPAPYRLPGAGLFAVAGPLRTTI